MSYVTKHLRARNAVERRPERLTSACRLRWALGRWVKRSLANHRWNAMQVWSLRERLADGQWRETARYATAAEAQAWVSFDKLGDTPEVL